MSTHNFANLDDTSTSFKKSNQSNRHLKIFACLAVVVAVALLIALIVVSTQDNSVSPVPPIRWCTVHADEQTKCNKMSNAFRNAGFLPLVECINRQEVDSCVSAIENGDADAITLDGGHIFDNRDMVKPILAEDYGFGDATYWAVAVVKKSDRSTSLTSAGLKNKKSCHTGYQKSAGWKMPMGTLKSLGIISGCDIRSGALNVFGSMCAPGGGGDLCKSCNGTCNRSCEGENYCGYTGAFRCMVESGDVAFVKHTTVYSNTDGNNQASWARQLLSSDYELLCKGGTRSPLSGYENCNLGKVPSHAVVVSMKASQTLISRIVELLYVAQLRFGPHTQDSFKLFDGSSPDLLFKSSTKLLLPLRAACTTQQYLGTSYLVNSYELMCKTAPSLPPATSCVLPQYGSDVLTTLRWCVTSQAEIEKCRNVSTKAQLLGSGLVISCKIASDVNACAKMISEKTADAISMDGGEIYNAGRLYNLQPVATEFYGESAGGEAAASYYAVAVVRASDSTTTLTKQGLQQKKTCHTGYQRTSGWNVPVGYLISEDILSSTGCEIPNQVSTFFGGSCVPGIRSSGISTPVADKLCMICSGTGDAKCSSSREPYRGYSGALQCLIDGAGDIAFVKHATALASGIDQSQYKLLCKDGTTKPVTEYLDCNIAQVPSHAFMISPSASEIYREKVWALLNQLQNLDEFQLFGSTGGSDLLFKDSTKCLWKVNSSCSWADFLGRSYLEATSALMCHNTTIVDGPCTFVSTCTE